MRSASRDQSPSSSPAATSPQNSRAGTASDRKPDLQLAIQRLLTFVRSEEFVSRFERLQLINPGTVRQLLKAAVAEVVGDACSDLDNGLEKTILERAEQEFIRKYANLRSEARAIEERILRLKACLDAAEDAVREPPRSPPASRSVAAYKDILAELEQRFTRSLRSKKTTAEIEESLRQGVRRLLVRLFKSELGTIQKRLELDSHKKVALLERKVRRLTAALEAASEERARGPERCPHPRKASAQAIRAVRLDRSDPASKVKLSLLEELVQFNRDMRAAIAAMELRAHGGREPDARRMAPPAQCMERPAGLVSTLSGTR